MAEQVGSVFYTIGAKDKELLDALKRSKGAVGNLDSQMKKSSAGISKSFKVIGLSAVAAFGAIVVGATKAVKAASDLNEQNSKFLVTFSDVADAAEDASQTLVDAYGLSERESKEFLSTTGDLVKGLGFSQEATLALATDLNKLAVDVTSFKNVQGGVTQTTRAFNSAILGEREALKSLGFSISEAEVKQVLLEKGQERLTGSSLRQAKALATIELIQKKNADAAGDFARTQDQVANVFRRVSSRTEDLQARLGKDLLPSVAELGSEFLKATDKGGFLEKGLSGIATVAKGAITILSNLIGILNRAFDEKLQKRIETGEEALDKTTDALKRQITAYTTQLEIMKKRGDSAEQLAKQEERIAIAERELESADEDLAATRRKSTEELKALTDAEKENQKEAEKLIGTSKKEIEIQNAKVAATKKELEARRKAQEDAQKIISEFGLTEIELIRKQGADRNAAINEALAKRRITEEQANDLKIINEVQTQEKITQIQEQAQQQRIQSAIAAAGTIITGVSGLLTALSSLVSANLAAATSQIDQQLESTLAAIDAQTEAQLEAAGLLQESEEMKLESSITMLENQIALTQSIAQKAAMQQLLADKKNELARLRILQEAEQAKLEAEEKAETERKKAARAAAEDQKDFSLANIALTTPLAAMRAYTSAASFGPVAAAIAAGLAISAGLAQAEAVRRTPLPALAEGGVIPATPGGQEVIVSEAGNAEAVIPLTEEILSQIGGGGNGQPINLTINLGSQVLFAEVNQGIEDREIIISESDLTTG
jgi:hypothetical protein